MIALILAAALAQCRVAVLHAHSTTPMYGNWESCHGAELDADAIAEPGVTVWTEERRKIGDAWTKPKRHTEPELVPPVNPRYKDKSTLDNI